MKKNLPKISIVIPSFNKGKFIKQTLDSIVDQKYQNLEVIVQDAGSSDSTLEILQNYTQKYSYISFRSKKDKGQTEAINIGLKRASGDLLTFINADDYYQPGALNAISNTFLKNPNALWFAGKGRVVNDSNQEVAELVTKYKSFLLGVNRYQLLLIVNYLYQPSVFLTRKALDQFGEFTGYDRFVLEYDLWLKMGKKEMPKLINKTLSSFRMSENNFSSTSFNKILQKDFEIAQRNTKNVVLLFLHKCHNIGRRFILSNLAD